MDREELMKQYISKASVVAEIKRRIREIDKYYCDMNCTYQRIEECKGFLLFLDTIEAKNVNLKKEFYDFLDTLTGKDDGHLSEDELFRIAEYFFELGLKYKCE